MIRLDVHLVLTPQLTPVEARMLIVGSWRSDDADAPPVPLRLEGKVVGPLCEYAETLSNPSRLRPASSGPIPPHAVKLMANARILEPCFWEPSHPFCYDVQVELHGDDGLLDMRRMVAGIRHLAVVAAELLLNGQEVFLRGVRHQAAATVEELELWHEVECSAMLVSATNELCDKTDRWGPIVLHILPRTKEEAREHVVKFRNHPSVLMWVLPSRVGGRDLDEIVSTIKTHDPSRPIGQLVAVDEMIPTAPARPVDLFFLPAGHWGIGSAELTKPYVVLADMEADPDVSQFENFTNQTDELCRSLGSPPGLVGVIL
jgi:hypothetical protein